MPAAPPEVSISVGNIGLSPHRTAAAVTRRVLEAHGHRVTSVEASDERLSGLQARGWLDVLVAAWLPSVHAPRLLRHPETARILTPQYHPHRVWAVPPYVSPRRSARWPIPPGRPWPGA